MTDPRVESEQLPDGRSLAGRIREWGRSLGFQHVGITGIKLLEDERRLARWLTREYQGTMDYMAKHGTMRARPEELLPGTLSVISGRMNYMTEDAAAMTAVLNDPRKAYISRYALGRDYHKLMRSRLKRLGQKISAEIGGFGYRVFTDSAPVLERALARKAGLGWFGKHTNLISREDGSWFFLGEIYTDLALPFDEEYGENHCGRCVACADACPTGAIVAPYEVDARRCISYLTIEYRGAIPVKYRPLMGNRIFGCDDCQLVCPWNRFARLTSEGDFAPRHGLKASSLIELFEWTEAEFLLRTEGSAIRRISYEQWLRNIAVALGNCPRSEAVCAALKRRLPAVTPLVAEHIQWAISRHNDGISDVVETTG